jgi:hypothetical protein
MKKLIFLIIPIVFTMCNVGPSGKEKLQLKNDSLQRLVMQKDSAMYAVLGTFTSIEDNLQSIKEKEKVIQLTASDNEDKKTREDKINEDIQLIYQMMQENKNKVIKLEKQLKKAHVKNKELEQIIEALQAKIQEKDAEILRLTEELLDMNIQVTELSYSIDTLKIANAAKQEVIQTQDENLNTAYYIIGSEKELKEMGVLDKKGGLLGLGAKNLNKDFKKEQFTKIDIRKVTTFKINAKKARIVTNHPTSSYKIYGEKPVDSLQIVNPNEFWSVSKYMVISVN